MWLSEQACPSWLGWHKIQSTLPFKGAQSYYGLHFQSGSRGSVKQSDLLMEDPVQSPQLFPELPTAAGSRFMYQAGQGHSLATRKFRNTSRVLWDVPTPGQMESNYRIFARRLWNLRDTGSASCSMSPPVRSSSTPPPVVKAFGVPGTHTKPSAASCTWGKQPSYMGVYQAQLLVSGIQTQLPQQR